MRKKFQKLSTDDTPMVRRGAAQSIPTLARNLEQEYSKEYLLPILKTLLLDDNDSVKIYAVQSSIIVAKLLKSPDHIVDNILPAF